MPKTLTKWLLVVVFILLGGILIFVILPDQLNTVGVRRPTTADSVAVNSGDEYLALGDSVAFGVGASSPQQLGYAGVLYSEYLKLAEPNLLYKNLALPGETSTSFIERPQSRSQLERALAELDAAQQAGHKISLITLTIGGNDMLAARGKNQTQKAETLARFEANLQTILRQLTSRTAGRTTLIITTYYNPFAANGPAIQEDALWLERANEIINKRAAEYKVLVADFFKPVLGREMALTWIGQGDIHPNTPGHAQLAAAVWQASGYRR